MRQVLYFTFGLLFLFFCQASLSAQVVKGERPYIDLEKLPSEAMEKGRIRIKLHPSLLHKAQHQPLQHNEKEEPVFGIAALDSLNQKVHVSGGRQTFSAALANKSYSQRQSQWGFPLWFELHFPRETDILQLLKSYSQLEEVDFAEPVYRREWIAELASPVVVSVHDLPKAMANDPLFSQQWHFHNTGQAGGRPGADISLPQAWDIETGKPEVVVAIIDQGLDVKHADLARNIWSGVGYNFHYDSPVISPGYRGTHTAGIIAAASNNQRGVAGIAGGWGDSRGASIMALQVEDVNTAVAMIWAADQGAAICHNAWVYGSPGVYEQAELDAIDYFNTYGGGAVMQGGLAVFHAGNRGKPGLWYPAAYSGAFSVAATNNQDQKASYSNYGPWVDVSSPGGEGHPLEHGILSTLPDNQYGYLSYSFGYWDFAASQTAYNAAVSGVAALVLSAFPNVFSPSELGDILKYSADDHYAMNRDFAGQLGFGRLNARAALELASQWGNMPKSAQNLSITSQTTSLFLQWLQNDMGDEVILVVSPEPLIGKPERGIKYRDGDPLPGGGTVVFSGNATSFHHHGLNQGRFYFYRIWSVNDQLWYSIPESAIASTQQAPISDYPYLESFEYRMMPPGWQGSSSSGPGSYWLIGRVPDGLAGTGSNYAYTESGAWEEAKGALISPVFNFLEASKVKLIFTHYLNTRSDHYHELAGRVLATKDEGRTWEEVADWWNSFPNHTLVELPIDHLAGSPSVQFKWELYFNYEGIWCIDDVRIEVASIPGAPVVLSHPVTSIGHNRASLHAEILDAGQGPLLAAGFLVSTDPFPENTTPGVMVFPIPDPGQAGPYQVMGTGLNEATFYYVRPYALNSMGLKYGHVVSFNTLYSTPFLEDFNETGYNYTPPFWEINPLIEGSIIWGFGILYEGLEVNTSFAGIFSFTGHANCDLVSPWIDILGASAARVSFLHYFHMLDSSAGTFWYRLDEDPWIMAYEWTGVITPNPDHYELVIAGLEGKGRLQLKFNYTGSYAYLWCIDDVRVTVVDDWLWAEQDGRGADPLVIYPNPARDQVFVDLKDIAGTISLSLFSMKGVEVLNSRQEVSGDLLKLSLPVSHLPNGIYFLRLVSAQGTRNGKFIVSDR